MIANWPAILAILGKCSEILMPLTEVAISLMVPPLAWPGLRSNVSIWLGPPFIHNRMQARLRSAGAVSLAMASSQGNVEAPTKPAHDKRNTSRRDNSADD